MGENRLHAYIEELRKRLLSANRLSEIYEIIWILSRLWLYYRTREIYELFVLAKKKYEEMKKKRR